MERRGAEPQRSKRRISTDGEKICPTAEKNERRRSPKRAISKQMKPEGEV